MSDLTKSGAKLPAVWAASLFVIVYLLTLLLNAGFMGTDEYWTGITRYVPAQEKDYFNMLREDDVKSPTQMIPLVWMADRALDLGITSPYSQYRFVQIGLGLICIAVLFFCLYRYSAREERFWLFIAFTFYGVAPFAFTRPMYESLSAPFVLLSALSLRDYLNTRKINQIWISTLAVSVAFAFRPQAGIAALILPLFLAQKKEYRALTLSTVIGLVCFVLLGIPDHIIRGSWHYSLKAILFYNVKYGASYAQQPWFFYLALSIVLLWVPFWISKKWPAIIRKFWHEQKVLWLSIFLVLALHSFFPQKWERFVIPVLPLMIWIVAQWAQAFWQEGAKIRVSALAALNLILWVPSSFFPAQQNIISMSLYLDENTDVKTLYRLNKNPEWITEAFIRRTDWKWVDVQESPPEMTCDARLVMNQVDYEKMTKTEAYVVEEVFETNALEKFAYKFNPSKNVRRTPLYLLKSSNCSN